LFEEDYSGWASKQTDDALVKALSTPNLACNPGVATELGKRGEWAVPHLVRALNNDDSFQVREAAADALAKIGSAEAVEALRKAAAGQGISEQPEFNVRIRALKLLFKLRDEHAMKILIETIRAPQQDWQLVFGALQLLLHQDPSFLNENSKIIVSLAAYCLDRPGAVCPYPMNTRDENVKSKAAEVLSRMNAVESIPTLIGFVTDKTHEFLKGVVALVLPRFKFDKPMPHLTKMLSDAIEKTPEKFRPLLQNALEAWELPAKSETEDALRILKRNARPQPGRAPEGTPNGKPVKK